MVAFDHLSRQQFMPVSELAKMRSWDHPGVQMSEVHQHLEPEHLQRVADGVAEAGRVIKPIHIGWPSDGEGPDVHRQGHGQPWVYDGHHRAAAAIAQGLSEVPVKHDTTTGWMKKYYGF